MQPKLIKLTKAERSSLSINRYIYDKFPGIWHYHPEYELTLIVKSCGTRLLGNHAERFEEDDLIFIGSNIPHTWKNNDDYANGAEALVIHFTPDCFGPHFFHIPEMESILSLFCKAQCGIKIHGRLQQQITSQMMRLSDLSGPRKVMAFLDILHQLAGSKELQLLSDDSFLVSSSHDDSERINRVFNFILENYTSDILLADAAKVANMSAGAFSRYFKERTRKSFSEFLMQLKISHACKLLMTEESSVIGVCYDSGFKSLSNFNKQFKHIMKQSPKKYQMQYRFEPGKLK